MSSLDRQNLIITPEKKGAREFLKVSYPIRYGCYGEIKTGEYVFQFNRNGEIKFIETRAPRGFDQEGWLKRTLGNDWVFYSPGSYGEVYDLYGQHYFPFLPYPSNALQDRNPFEEEGVRSGLEAWRRLRKGITGSIPAGIGREEADFLSRVAAQDEERLAARARKFHRLTGGPVSVLPPDARHVDYEVIPLIVADGCSYHCRFCRVKSGQDFAARSPQEIDRQIEGLRVFLDRDLSNYNAVFLGNHDALRVEADSLKRAAEKAYDRFELDRSYMKGVYLFLFGSVDSFLEAKEALFEGLNQLPFYLYLNLGLESVDQETLERIGKPVEAGKVREAFEKMLAINRRYERVEVSGNFVLGEDLPQNHLLSLVEMVSRRPKGQAAKGTLYLSPMVEGPLGEIKRRRTFLRQFHIVKSASFLPVYLYLIQRL